MPKPVKGQSACYGCGEYHGPPTAEINCLRDALTKESERRRRAERRVEELDAAIAAAVKVLR
jgi:hypothetical protein